MKDPFERIADQEDGRDDGLTWYFGETKQQMAERLGPRVPTQRQRRGAGRPYHNAGQGMGPAAPG
jgi:hypothetical protein